MKKQIITITLLLISALSVLAQSKKEFRTDLDSLIFKSRNNKSYSIKFEKYYEKFPDYVIIESAKYLNDSVGDVRYAAIKIFAELVRISKDLEVRQKATYELVNTHSYSLHTAATYLKQFNKEDFNSMAKDSLREFLTQKEKRHDDIILLIGYLDLYDQISVLKNFLANPKDYGARSRWKMQICLARLGDIEMARKCIAKAKTEGCSHQAVYRLFPDLIYTRHKMVFDYLVSVMQNDEMKTSSANPSNNAKISCGYRIMELFPGVVENYPLEKTWGNQIKTNNYKEALNQARQWFTDNPDYKILRDKF